MRPFNRRPIRAIVPAVVAALIGLGACTPSPLASPAPFVEGEDHATLSQNLRNRVDVLFVVDNSQSMDAMSAELRSRFSQFFEPFQRLAAAGTYADLHIGVITTDYGAGATGSLGCETSGGGGRGRLIARGSASSPTCKSPTGAAFIDFAFGPDGEGRHNLPDGQDLVETFTCMASVGTSGCGFEHVLESTRAALRDDLPGNQGFLRDDALLAVVFLTNEDDCSAPPASRLFDKVAASCGGLPCGPLGSYRCARFGLLCDGAPPPEGAGGDALAGCVPAPNPEADPERLFDVSRYIDLFARPAIAGGLKDDPGDVILVGITGPSGPVQVTWDKNGGACDPTRQTCQPALAHSCQNEARPVFFADPAVRLNTVIAAAPTHAIVSICEDDYGAPMRQIADLIVTRLPLGCITARLPRDSAGALVADCVVQDVTDNPDGTVTVRPLPACEGELPCYRVVPRPECESQSPDGVGVVIERDGSPPARTTAHVACHVRS